MVHRPKEAYGLTDAEKREMELLSSSHAYTATGRYTVAIEVIDIFGNDTMAPAPVNVG